MVACFRGFFRDEGVAVESGAGALRGALRGRSCRRIRWAWGSAEGDGPGGGGPRRRIRWSRGCSGPLTGRVPSSLSTRVSRRGFRVIDRAGWSVLGRACGLAGTLLPLSPGEGRIWVLRVMVISTAPVTCSVGLASVCGGGALLVVQWSGGLVVQNASGFRCFRRTQHEGGPKCVSVRRFWRDPGDFGQTQTHFGPGVRKDPESARDSDAFRTTKQLNHRATGAGLAPAVADPGHCPGRPRTPGRRAAGSNNVPADSAEVPHCAPA